MRPRPVTLDGDFLNMDEFIHMVNGGGSYPANGWHGMYAMSGVEKSNDRIYKVDDKLDIFVDHAILAAKQFISDRRLLTFGPFLAFGLALAALYGDQIVTWYLHFL